MVAFLGGEMLSLVHQDTPGSDFDGPNLIPRERLCQNEQNVTPSQGWAEGKAEVKCKFLIGSPQVPYFTWELASPTPLSRASVRSHGIIQPCACQQVVEGLSVGGGDRRG